MVSLRGVGMDGSSSLETHLEHLALNIGDHVARLALELEIDGLVSRVLLNHLELLK